MAVLTVRIDDETRAALERLGRARNMTVSDLLRGQMDVLLGRGMEPVAPDAPTSLSMYERRSLAQQHEILALLDEGEREHHQLQAEVLTGGYTAEYSDGFVAFEPELSHADCELVWDIFDMFTVLEASTRALGQDTITKLDEHAGHALRFRGFDANDRFESRLLRYGKYLIETGRWTNLANRFDSSHERGNSHARSLPTYRRMLAVFQPMWRSKMANRGFSPEALRLTEAELALVMDAWPYPS